MEEWMERLYENAQRFDKGGLCRSAGYEQVRLEAEHIRVLAEKIFGSEIGRLLDCYEDTLGEMAEYEARHFFSEGVRIGAVGIAK